MTNMKHLPNAIRFASRLIALLCVACLSVAAPPLDDCKTCESGVSGAAAFAIDSQVERMNAARLPGWRPTGHIVASTTVADSSEVRLGDWVVSVRFRWGGVDGWVVTHVSSRYAPTASTQTVASKAEATAAEHDASEAVSGESPPDTTLPALPTPPTDPNAPIDFIGGNLGDTVQNTIHGGRWTWTFTYTYMIVDGVAGWYATEVTAVFRPAPGNNKVQ